ncbi:Chromatin assembly factor 1 subunit rlf2, partial [Frankliniella fusca]
MKRSKPGMLVSSAQPDRPRNENQMYWDRKEAFATTSFNTYEEYEIDDDHQ